VSALAQSGALSYRALMPEQPSNPAHAAKPPQAVARAARETWRADELASVQQLSQAALAAAQGDEQAFAALSQRLAPGVRAVLLDRVARKHDVADDLTQRTMLGLWQALRAGRYDPQRSAITTFVYAVAHKVWLQHARADGRRLAAQQRYTLNTVLPEANAAQDDVAAVADTAALLQHVRRALDEAGESASSAASSAANGAGLTDDERWLLRNWAGGVSDRELAKRMGIAASNVNGRKQVAYRKLRAWLTQLGFAMEAPPHATPPTQLREKPP
jgi:RNA polymerase sigma factor (sigma-70 family)